MPITLAMPTDDELEDWIRSIYKNSEEAGLHIPSVQAFADRLWHGLQQGYGKGFEDVQYGDREYDMLYRLRKDVYHFSMAKNHAELRALTGAVVTNGGKVRSFQQFRKEAAKITGTFRGHWLQAEYELSVAGGQMSSKWVEFERTGDDTMLRFSTVGDSRVSDICRPLDGVTKPINDPFWDVYYPPNHFRCRSDVDRVPYSSPITADGSYSVPEIPKMMRTNLAKQGLVFPKNHPYYNGMKSQRDAVNLMMKTAKLEDQYLSVENKIKCHFKTFNDRNEGPDPDYDDKLRVAGLVFQKGEVFLLPEIHHSEVELRTKILPNVKRGRNPDYQYHGEYYEYKRSRGETALSERFKKATEQADRIIIELFYDKPDKYLYQMTHRSFANNPNLKIVYWIKGNKVLKIRNPLKPKF